MNVDFEWQTIPIRQKPSSHHQQTYSNKNNHQSHRGSGGSGTSGGRRRQHRHGKHSSSIKPRPPGLHCDTQHQHQHHGGLSMADSQSSFASAISTTSSSQASGNERLAATSASIPVSTMPVPQKPLYSAALTDLLPQQQRLMFLKRWVVVGSVYLKITITAC